MLYLFVHWRYRLESLSVFIFPLVFVMTLVATLGNPVSAWSSPVVRNAWLTVHIVLVLLGYAALLFTAVASLLYLFQERELKTKKPRKFYYRLPPLGTLDELISQVHGRGLRADHAGGDRRQHLGVHRAEDRPGSASPTSPSRSSPGASTWRWCSCASAAGWRGRKAAIMTVAVVGLSRAHLGGARPAGSVAAETMKLLVTGVSHKTAPVEVRECLAFREEALPAALADLKAREGVAEAVILSTCNRVEITRHHRTTVPTREPSSMTSWPTQKAVEPQTRSSRTSTGTKGRDAIHHLFRVAASLDSMVVGEPQILGQLKTAYAAAKDCGAVCGWLDGLLDARLQRGQAGALGNRHRADGGFGELRGGGAGAQDFRLARQPHRHDRGRGQDVGAGRAPPAPLRRLARLRHQPHPRARRGNGRAVPGHAGRIHALRGDAAGSGYRDRLVAARRTTSCTRTKCSA